MDFKPRQEELSQLKEVCGTCQRPVAQCACAVKDRELTMDGSLSGQLTEGPLTTVHPDTAGLPPASTYIQGKYKIGSLIGEGGMGRVFKGTHEALNKTFAIKVLRSEVIADNRAIRRFDQEAKASSQLTHPNLCQIFDYGLTDDGMPYLVMEYLEGQDLKDVIGAEGPLQPARVVNLFIEACDGIMHAHSKGVIHRDLKPSNIILTKRDDVEGVKIVDFGIAKMLPAPGTEGNQLTQTGEIFGSPLYMSPEQCQGLKVDVRSDIYSLGCVMYECLSGKPPFAGDNPVQTILKHVNEAARPFETHLNIPGGLQKIVMCALEKNPDNRYQTAQDLYRDLQRLRDGQAPSGYDTRPGTPKSFIRPRKKVLLFGAKIFLLSTLVIVGSACIQFYQAVSKLPNGAPSLADIISMNGPAEPWRQTFEQAKTEESTRNPVYAEASYQRALEQTRSSLQPDKSRLEVLQRMGDFYLESAEKGEGTYPEARKCFAEAVTIALKAGTTFAKAHTLDRLGEIDYKLKHYSVAENEYAQALKYREAGANDMTIVSTLMKQALNFNKQGKYEESRLANTRAIECLKKFPGQELFISNAYKGIAQAYADESKLPQADDAYKKAEEYLTRVSGTPARIDMRQTVKEHGDLLKKMGRNDDAAALKKKFAE